jgi:CRISPR-associated protein Csm3
MAWQSQQDPKPYDFVPLPDRVDRAKPSGHDGFKRGLLSGAIVGEVVALSPVHVASGNIELTNSDRVPLVKAHFRTDGRVAIPGSSLKGTIRSIVEAVTRSCVRVQSRAVRERLPRQFEPCEIRDRHSQVCLACRLFGAMSYQGQVRFSDAILVEGKVGTILAPSLFAPRTHAGRYYGPDGKVKGRKFYFHGRPANGNVPIEVCDVGSRFNLGIEFINLTEAEIGVLLVALGQGPSHFNIKLGGAKPACCGSVEILVQCVQTRDTASDALEFDSAVKTADVTPWLAAAATSLVPMNLKQLQSILKRDDQRSCPSQTY